MKKLTLLALLTLLTAGVCMAQTLPSYVPTSGLMAWYSFTGNAADGSGNGNNGTVLGATLTTDRFGNANSAYFFNGSAEITTSLRPPAGNAARTFSCWFKYASLPDSCGDNSVCLTSYGGNTSACTESGKNFALHVNFSPAVAQVGGICVQTSESGTGDTLDNNWHFFAAVYDPSWGDFYNIKIYVDGVYQTTTTNVYGGTSAVNTDTLTKLQIGKDNVECARYFDGTIDDIGVWNRALSESELFILYQTTPIAATDSFAVYVASSCNGPAITIEPANYSPALNVQTWFGDGTQETDTFSSATGNSSFNHTYLFPGVYTIKHVLYSGGSQIDSVQYNYTDVFCNTLPVALYYDINGNCIKDVNESYNDIPLSVEVDSNGLPVDTISCTSGLYYPASGLPGDIYAFRLIPSSGITFTCGGIVYDTLQATGQTTGTKYIGLQGIAGSSFDLSVQNVIAATGPHDQSANIYVDNSFALPVNATVTLRYSGKYTQISPVTSPPPTSYTDSTIIWDVANLSALTGTVHLYYAVRDSSLPYVTIGDTIHAIVTVTPLAGDTDTTNNIVIHIDTVKAGCDPNQMSVSPAGCIAPGSVNQLLYTINFMNTGNDTAFNISVLDTLPNTVDLNTLKIVMASATMNTELLYTGTYNIVKFDFPQINLLDSAFNAARCSGAVIFTVNTIPGLTDGVTIANHAGVFFDINSVVLTNTVTDTVGCDGLSVAIIKPANTTSIYPNPTHDAITITSSANITHINISNLLGQSVYDCGYNSPQVQVSVADLPTGVYFVKINGTDVRKFAKE